MKFKSLVSFASILTVLAIGNPIQADQLISEPKEIHTVAKDMRLGKVSVELDQERVKLILSEPSQTFEEVKATVWTLAEKKDKKEVELKLDQDGRYTVFLERSDFDASSEIFSVEIEAKLSEDKKQVFDIYQFTWVKEEPTTTSEEEPTSSEVTTTTTSLFEPSTTIGSSSSSITSSSSNVSSSVSSGNKTKSKEPNASQPSTSASKKKATKVTQEVFAPGVLNVTNHNYSAGSFDIIVNLGGAKSVKAVKIPVWTDENGQDDIRWYDAKRQSNGTYKVTVSKKNHRNGTGDYHVHLYYEYTNGQLKGIAAETTTLAAKNSGKLYVRNANVRAGTFDIIVTDITTPVGLKTVYLPVWSEVNGQDDIKWYKANKQYDGTYRLTVNKKNHKNVSGSYRIDLYYLLTNGQTVGIRSSRINLGPTGTIRIRNLQPKEGTFDIEISNVATPKGIRSVQVPVWTEENGQDDIKWYSAKKQANGTYQLTIRKRDHKNGTGLYHAHLYYRYEDGTQEGMGAATVTMPIDPAGKISVANANLQAGTFDVYISGIKAPASIKEVQVPIWTDDNGQDDIRWYKASKQADGRYKVTVDKRNHKNGLGLYIIHLYYQYADGSVHGVASSELNFNPTEPAGNITIRHTNPQAGEFDIIITGVNTPKVLDLVQVPVWSDIDGQDDIRWYTATKQADGSYKVSVKASDHKYSNGLYHVHLYLKQRDGKQYGVAMLHTQVRIDQSKSWASFNIQNVDNTYGVFDIIVSSLHAPAGVDKVEVPVWSEVNGQNDIVWYEAARQTDGTYRVTVRLANHNYETGLYHAHLYVTSKGQRQIMGTLTTTVGYKQKSGQSFIDVSSHNGYLSVADYRQLINQGVAGVVVKLTEATSYLNPLAESQIRNAQAAGLKVSVYHYSHFTNATEAREEARYFVAAAKRLGLSQGTLMVNDIEEEKSKKNVNANMKEWEKEMKRLGYHNLMHYTGASWIDVNSLGYAGPVQTSQFGLSNFWVAQYPYVNGMSLAQARAMSLHSRAAAWQFTSKAVLLAGRPYFDLNIDYTGRFTK